MTKAIVKSVSAVTSVFAVIFVLAGCVHKPVTETPAAKLAEFKQTILKGVGRTSKANGYLVSLHDDNTGFAWMKGDTASRGVKWAIRNSDKTVGKTLELCLTFGPAINFPEGRVFCSKASDWDPAGAWTSVPSRET